MLICFRLFKKIQMLIWVLAIQVVSISISQCQEMAVVPLDADIRKNLDRGEVSDRAKIAGIIVGLLPGALVAASNYMSGDLPKGDELRGFVLLTAITPAFGLGELAQGRYMETGWMVTAGEFGGVLVGAAFATCFGASRCGEIGPGLGIIFGGATILVVRVLELLDLFEGPKIRNRKYQDSLRQKANQTSLYFAPTIGGGGTAGLTFLF